MCLVSWLLWYICTGHGRLLRLLSSKIYFFCSKTNQVCTYIFLFQLRFILQPDNDCKTYRQSQFQTLTKKNLCISSVFLFLSVQSDSYIVLFKIRGTEIHATTTTTRRRVTWKAAAVRREGRISSFFFFFLFFFDFEMETCRWDVKNSITFKFSVKSHGSHLDRTCCLPVTALVIS